MSDGDPLKKLQAVDDYRRLQEVDSVADLGDSYGASKALVNAYTGTCQD
jgi:hypothetical protein